MENKVDVNVILNGGQTFVIPVPESELKETLRLIEEGLSVVKSEQISVKCSQIAAYQVVR